MKLASAAIAILMATCFAYGQTPAKAATYTDPVGDAVAGTPGLGSVPIDIASVSVSFDATNFFVGMTFDPATPIAPASASAANSIFAILEFDTDRNPTTGPRGFVDILYPLVGESRPLIGVEGRIDVGSELNHPGLVNVFNFPAGTNTQVPVTFTPTSFSLTIPRSIFGNAGIVDFAALAGTTVVTGPTDASPTPFGTSSAVPEPSTLIMLLLGCGGFVAFRGRHA